MKFTFKGGSSMMLLLDHPVRLSTDIDIIVDPGTDVDGYIEAAGTIFPFLRKEEDIRKGRNNIEKRHFKFIYFSPIRQAEFYILLDIVFMESPYDQVVTKPIKNDLLATEPEDLTVTMPTLECLLGDKLTAFAPHTTGVPLGKKKELEIAKQLFDVSTLAEQMQDQLQFRMTYDKAVAEELAFRGIGQTREDVLRDTIRACVSIISRGAFDEGDYAEYMKGIRALTDHILGRKFTPEVAAEKACSVMCLAASVLTRTDYPRIGDPAEYARARLAGGQYKRLAYIRKRNLEAYGYLVEATKMLETI
ncbi:MAG: nucleotidyl transferase AbiEii/AbiGii toxin family protein [Solobacterium sp.]|nr:nucleotidyl transferase AbiEii/AbiGii toxin family protein [Solobacterium sp.]